MSEEWQDPFIDQESGLLRNRLNIKDQQRLEEIEGAFSSLRIAELGQHPLKVKQYDLEHLQAIHKYIFQDVYDWAGQVRDFSLWKGETRFAPPTIIQQGSDYLFGRLAREKHLRGLDADDFSKRAGYYLGEINHLHPFREGNGRTQRCFINQLAQQSGYSLSWNKTTQAEMIKASVEADKGDHSFMSEIIKTCLQDREYELIEAKYSDKVGANIKHATEGSNYRGKIIGTTERYLVQELEGEERLLILHNRRSLVREIKDATSVEISYPHGKVGLVRDGHSLSKSDAREIKYEKDRSL